MISSLNKPPRQSMAAKPKASSISVSPILMELAYAENTDVFTKLKTSSNGLAGAEVDARMGEYGPNDVAIEKQGAGYRGCSRQRAIFWSFCLPSWPPSRSQR